MGCYKYNGSIWEPINMTNLTPAMRVYGEAKLPINADSNNSLYGCTTFFGVNDTDPYGHFTITSNLDFPFNLSNLHLYENGIPQYGVTFVRTDASQSPYIEPDETVIVEIENFELQPTDINDDPLWYYFGDLNNLSESDLQISYMGGNWINYYNFPYVYVTNYGWTGNPGFTEPPL